MIQDYTLRALLSHNRDVLTSSRIDKGFDVRPLWKTLTKLQPSEMVTWVDRFDSLCPLPSEWALVQAFEVALKLDISRRRQFVRSIFCEINRLIWLTTYLGRLMGALGQTVMRSHAYVFREQVFSLQEELTGGRILPQVLNIGGSRRPIALGDIQKIRQFMKEWKEGWEPWKGTLLDDSVLAKRLQGLMVIPPELVRRMGWWGIVGKAAGINYDSRKHRPHGAYAFLDFEIPVGSQGDALARMHQACFEVDLTLNLIEMFLEKIPPPEDTWASPLRDNEKPASGFYSGSAESPKGPVISLLHIAENGSVSSVRLFTTGQRIWPVVDSLFEGILGEDFELAFVSLGIDSEEAEL